MYGMRDPEQPMDLATLLEHARSASPAQRIEWRDPIVAHGADAIEGVAPWLADEVLAAFAVRVIEHAGLAGHEALAGKVLRGARKRAPESVSGDIEWALRRLREASRPQGATPASKPAPKSSSTARRESPRFPVQSRSASH
jgi:hypothetical protein